MTPLMKPENQKWLIHSGLRSSRGKCLNAIRKESTISGFLLGWFYLCDAPSPHVRPSVLMPVCPQLVIYGALLWWRCIARVFSSELVELNFWTSWTHASRQSQLLGVAARRGGETSLGCRWGTIREWHQSLFESLWRMLDVRRCPFVYCGQCSWVHSGWQTFEWHYSLVRHVFPSSIIRHPKRGVGEILIYTFWGFFFFMAVAFVQFFCVWSVLL